MSTHDCTEERICKDEKGNCIAAAIVSDYVIENKSLKQKIAEYKEEIALLKKGLLEYATRITNGELDKLKDKITQQNIVIDGVLYGLQTKKNKGEAINEAILLIERYKYYSN
jgi:predicted RNase H-like nuclease (RuvC/YqgF family)